ncbi:MAG: long-chain fatty acid--CoA ligase [Alphaproteobacteria bacterium]|nr:MAG: long-chain fatty acid--CoA ligase [Alphaproteobacteria bacterium]
MDAIFDEGPPPPCPEPFNLAAYVLGRAAERADRNALIVVHPAGAERWSYARLEAAVRGTAAGLLALGLEPGDRVLMRLGNTVEFPVVFLAALAVDLVPVPTSALLTVPEVSRIAAEIAPRLIVAGEGVSLPADPPCPVIGPDALAAMREAAPADYAMGPADRPGYIIYTSGTSGSPRAVVHAHRAIWARRMMWEGWYGLTAEDRLLHAGAFNWTYTLGTGLLDPWTLGATALIPRAGVRPDHLPLLIRRFDATIFAAAPGVYRQMLRHNMPRCPKLRHGLSAGEKLPEATRAAWQKATGTAIHEAYGMSECSTFVSGSPARPAPPATLGYPQRGRRVAVLGAEGRPVARGEPGVLAVSRRDPGLMLGYLGAEEETAARFAGEWFVTGDMVSMGADGAISYLGRSDDMMNAGGVRVSPLEVERALAEHPAIEEVAAAEVEVKPDVTVIAAFIVTAGEPDEAELDAFAAGRLARYKCPRLWVRVPRLPRGANGKILRRKLREDWEANHGAA